MVSSYYVSATVWPCLACSLSCNISPNANNSSPPPTHTHHTHTHPTTGNYNFLKLKTQWTPEQRAFLDNDFAIQDVDEYSFNIYNQRLNDLQGAFEILRGEVASEPQPPPPTPAANNGIPPVSPFLALEALTNNNPKPTESPCSILRQKTAEVFPRPKDDVALDVPTFLAEAAALAGGGAGGAEEAGEAGEAQTGAGLGAAAAGEKLSKSSSTDTTLSAPLNVRPTIRTPVKEQVEATVANAGDTTMTTTIMRLTPRMILASPKRMQKSLEEQLTIEMLQEQRKAREEMMSRNVLENWVLKKQGSRMEFRVSSAPPILLGVQRMHGLHKSIHKGSPSSREEEEHDDDEVFYETCLDLYNALGLQRYDEGEALHSKEQWLRGMHVIASGTAIVKEADVDAKPTQTTGAMLEPYCVVNGHVLSSLSGHVVSRGTVVAGDNGCSTMYLDGVQAQRILNTAGLVKKFATA